MTPTANTLHGVPVSGGVAIGRAVVIDRRHQNYPKRHIADAERALERQRLQDAVAQTTESLQALAAEAERAGQEEAQLILNAHLLMAQDPLLLDAVVRHIDDDNRCAEWALKTAVRAIRTQFDALSDPYFRQRQTDVDVVGERILSALGRDDTPAWQIGDNAIVIAHNLAPADVLQLLQHHVLGLVTEVGGQTSHSAILARALEIPAIVGCAGVLEQCGNGDQVVVDAHRGHLVITPGETALAAYAERRARQLRLDEQLLASAEAPATTTDGVTVSVLANIDIEDEVTGALAHGAEGVGLYRTEFLFVDKKRLPSVHDHERAYRYVHDAMGPTRTVTFRSFDLGSDKIAGGLPILHEENPALGLRACRLALKHPDLFRAQLRGLLRASRGRPLSIMFPMITGVAELRQVRTLFSEECRAAERDGTEPPSKLRVGIMIEAPSAVWVADDLAKECDFFSIGTNDLIQYSLGIDRQNEHVAYLYEPLHPSNLRALAHVIKAANAAGIDVSMCGQMAAEPMYAGVLLGLGLRTLSMPNLSIPRVKWALRHLSAAKATALTDELLSLPTAAAIRQRVQEAMHTQVGELFTGAADVTAAYPLAGTTNENGAALEDVAQGHRST